MALVCYRFIEEKVEGTHTKLILYIIPYKFVREGR